MFTCTIIPVRKFKKINIRILGNRKQTYILFWPYTTHVQPPDMTSPESLSRTQTSYGLAVCLVSGTQVAFT